MLTSKINKAAFDALSPVLQAEYSVLDATKPDEYMLQTDDATELRNAKAREVTARVETQRKLDVAEAAKATAEAALAEYKTANPGKEQLESAWVAKLQTQQVEATKKVDAAKEALRKTLVENATRAVVSSIAEPEDADLLFPHVVSRIKVSVDGVEDGNPPKITYLDGDGLESADTAESFKKTIANDKRYAKIITGSKATGGGAVGGGGKSGDGGAGATKKFADMNEHDRRNLSVSNPVEFERLRQEHVAAKTVATYGGGPALIR